MKRSIAMVIVLAVICFLFASCYSINQPVVVPTINPVGSKVGMASGTVFFDMFGKADASIQAAMKNGNITKISTVEYKAKYTFFSIIQTFTVTVTGE
jgi:hypothetical protein